MYGITYLKVKVKSLAEEARIIRREECRLKSRPVPKRPAGWEGTLSGLHSHRTQNVREEARATHLAYGFLRGRSRSQIEGGALTEPSWDRVEAMVKRYGWRRPPTAPHKNLIDELEHWKRLAEPDHGSAKLVMEG